MIELKIKISIGEILEVGVISKMIVKTEQPYKIHKVVIYTYDEISKKGEKEI